MKATYTLIELFYSLEELPSVEILQGDEYFEIEYMSLSPAHAGIDSNSIAMQLSGQEICYFNRDDMVSVREIA